MAGFATAARNRRDARMAGQLKRAFCLAPTLAYFDSSGFGPVHKDVLAFQMEIRREIETHPSRFMRQHLMDRLVPVREALANFVSAPVDELGFVPNASIGLNTILWNLPMGPGDVILLLENAYRGLANAVSDYASRSGATLRRVPLRLPIAHTQDVLDELQRALDEHVRYAFIEHVTSPTALVLPVTAMVDLLAKRGVTTVVDGAGAPGLLPLDLRTIRSDFYVGNCHKWLGAPRASAFIRISRCWQSQMRGIIRTSIPLTSSSGRALVQRETEWLGTYDPSAYLTVGKAIDLMGSLYPGGWTELWQRNHLGLLAGIRYLEDQLGVKPLGRQALASPALALVLPSSNGQLAPHLQSHLYENEVAAVCFEASGNIAMRIGHHVFNEASDYERLADAVTAFGRR